MLGTATQAPSANTGPAVYRHRRPAATLLHRTVREHLETYLATAGHGDDLPSSVPFHVQKAFREYLRCGMESLRDPAFGDDSHTGSRAPTARPAAMTS